MLRRWNRCLFAGETGASGGGDGGDGGNAAAPITEADVGRIVNSAVTSHLKRAVPGAVTEAVTSAIGGIDLQGMVSAAVQSSAPAQPPAAADQTPAVDPMIAKLQDQNKALADKFEAAQKARQDEAIKAQQDRAYASLATELGTSVRPDAVDVASTVMRARNMLTIGEDGTATMTIMRAPYAGAEPEEVSVSMAEGVKHWASTDEGKMFAPSPVIPTAGNTRPPRTRPGGAPNGVPVWNTPAKTDAEKASRAATRAAAIMARQADNG